MSKGYHWSPPETHDRDRKRNARAEEYADRQMIAWDGEGMKLSGDDSPQHYVLFGCSAEPETPLVITGSTGNLTFQELADYAIDVAQRHPGAFHVGYFFNYDQNMIVHSLPWRVKQKLYEDGAASYKFDNVRYRVSYISGKKLRLTRIRKDQKAQSILIEDMATFWSTSFVNAYCQTFDDWQDDATFAKVIEGKKHRASMLWDDMPIVREYWYHEIKALARLAESLKDMMTRSGFPLRAWYGPGAFANAIRQTFKLKLHEHGGKEDNLSPDIHSAIKAAFFGGHFEQYQMGRIQGPIHYVDINSAYPAAFRTIPTMRDGGFWQEIPEDQLYGDLVVGAIRNPLTVYHVEYDCTKGNTFHSMFGGTEINPLPHRSLKGEITYPPQTHGWYWSPEVALVHSATPNYLHITRGYRWIAASDEYPWREIIDPMFDKRLELKAANDPAQMVFKLGPNSLYGKMAQRVGSHDGKPPGSHTLCIAGYLTSWCRAQVMGVILIAGIGRTIAVETDGVYMTCSPDEITDKWPDFTVSKAIGEWGIDTYDEICYLQNGVYLTRIGDKWNTKTRGMAKDAVSEWNISAYFDMLEPLTEWKPLVVDNGEQFAGLGTSVARSINVHGQVNPFKAAHIHCVWRKETKQIDVGGQKGKRRHLRSLCSECRNGISLNEGPHTLFVNSRSWNQLESASHTLPWETKEEPSWRNRIDTQEEE